ncbi:MAG TPA: FixH family protein [Symbiobacteriaceae bacterium]|nr:FixH family protein [Symbiobacteriaceae bacterium]
MIRTGIRRLAALLGLLAVGLFLVPGTALAHAVLQSSEPRSGAVVQTAPPWVRVQFNEPVEAAFTPLMVYDRAGNRVDKGDAQVDPGDATAAIVGLQSLPEGFYTVSYRVTSADGHPVEGAYGFSVGAKAVEGEPLYQAKSTALVQAVGLVHGLAAWGVVLLAGLPLFLAFVWRPVFPQGADRFTAILAGLAGGLILIGLGEVGLYAVRASGEGFSAGILIQALFKSRVGLLWLLRMGLGLVAGLVLPGIAKWLGGPRLLTVINGLVAGGLLLTLSLSSHAAAAGGALPILADWLHLVAASFWAGGLLGFVLALPGADREALPQAVRRFSVVVTGAVLLLGTTGLYATLLHVDAWSELVKTEWGQSLVTKLVLLIPLLLLGLINLRREGRRPFRHLVAGELVLITALFVAVGYLTSVPPAKVAALPQGPFAQTQTVDGLQVTLQIEPFQFGYNDALIQVAGRDGSPVAGANVGLRITMLEHEMGKQDPEAKEEASGHYRAPEILLAMEGKWRVEVVILTAAGQEVRVPFEVRVPKQLAP